MGNYYAMCFLLLKGLNQSEVLIRDEMHYIEFTSPLKIQPGILFNKQILIGTSGSFDKSC